MMKPSYKSEILEQSLKNMFGFDRRENIEQNFCVPEPFGCGQPITEFRNEISAKEYTISGLCQKCQDEFFGTV